MSAICPDARRPGGFALLAALFLLLVLGLLASVMLSLSSTMQQSALLDLHGSRSYQAARAGIEYAAYQAINANQCPASHSLTLGGLMDDLSIALHCQSSSHDVGGNTVTVYQLTATACRVIGSGGCGAASRTLHYVERQLSASVLRCVDPAGGSC